MFELNMKLHLSVLIAVTERKVSDYISTADCPCSRKICLDDKLSTTSD